MKTSEISEELLEQKIKECQDKLNKISEDLLNRNDCLVKMREELEELLVKSEEALKNANTSEKQVQEIYHEKFDVILKLVSIKLPIFLVGPSGCGKKVIIRQCCEALGKNFFYQNDTYEEHKLFGFVDDNGIYHKTPFYDAFINGGILMLDEIDNNNMSFILKLNSALESGEDFYMTFPNGEYLKANKDFQVVVATNTYGTGFNQSFNKIDINILDKFFICNIDYDKKLERELVKNPEILNLFWEVRRVAQENKIKHIVSTKGIVNIDKIISNGIIDNNSFTLGDVFDGTLIKGLDVDDLKIIVSKIKSNDEFTMKFLKYLKEKFNISQSIYQDVNVNNIVEGLYRNM